MPECEKGRQCAKCDCVVTDFRGMEIREILKTHQLSKNKLCGIYDSKISNYISYETPKVQYQKSFRFGLAGLFALSLVFAEGIKASAMNTMNKLTPEIHLTNQKDAPFISKNTSKKKVIKGVVKDKEGVLSGAKVWITDLDGNVIIIVKSDEKGKFKLDLTDEFKVHDSLLLKANFIGIGEKEIEIYKNNEQKYFKIILEHDDKYNSVMLGLIATPILKDNPTHEVIQPKD